MVKVIGLDESLSKEIIQRLTEYGNSRSEDIDCNIEVEQYIDKNRQMYVWYGGEVVTIQYKGYKISLAAYGDVEARLFGHDDHEIARVKDR